mgnify:CR=1 FL=1
MSKTKIGSNAQYTSAGKGLTTIGKHCYAYSGVYKATTSFQEVLSFQTGKHYVKGMLQLNSGIDLSSPANRVLNSAKTTFNGVTVSFIATGTSTDDSPTSQTELLIIPPLTLVVVEVDSSATADRDFTVGFVGKVHNG